MRRGEKKETFARAVNTCVRKNKYKTKLITTRPHFASLTLQQGIFLGTETFTLTPSRNYFDHTLLEML